jgi:hypothetical protein
MRVRTLVALLPAIAIVTLLASAQTANAQVGKLNIHVTPRQAYVFADGAAVVEAKNHFLVLDPGEHKIALYNYGYKPETRTVNIQAGQVTSLDVTLQPIPGTLNGPWGCITVEGANRDAILLNGKTPDFFVAHGDEINNDFIWKQELIVPPGHYELTVMAGDPHLWTVAIDVPANQRVVIDAFKSVRKTVPWSRGEKLAAQPQPRFKAGTASAQIAVEKVTGQFSANPTQINCGDSAHLNWTSQGAVKDDISGIGEVGASGDQTVEPKQTTTYKFTAAGPGGIVTHDATVDVNSAIQASLTVSPAEVRYHKVADKVEQQGSATVTWSTSNAQTVTLEPFGTVDANGSRTVPAIPTNTTPGPVDETVTYTLKAANTCGGEETRTASLRIVGSIEAKSVETITELESRMGLNSIYFQTDLPIRTDPSGGLLESQQDRLKTLASNFKEYLGLRPQASLVLEGHADRRGSKRYNMGLSERRVDRVKSFLVELGVPAASIQTKAFGEEDNLKAEDVTRLVDENPNLSEQDRAKIKREWRKFILANNRRVDIVLEPAGIQSRRFYPFSADDAKILMSLRSGARR